MSDDPPAGARDFDLENDMLLRKIDILTRERDSLAIDLREQQASNELLTEWRERAIAAEAELERKTAALRDCRDAILSPLNSESIVCTVWHSEGETLVDRIDAALSPSDNAEPTELERLRAELAQTKAELERKTRRWASLKLPDTTDCNQPPQSLSSIRD